MLFKAFFPLPVSKLLLFFFKAMMLLFIFGSCTTPDTEHDLASSDTATIGNLYREAWKIRTSDPNKAYTLSKEALALSKKINYTRGTAYALRTVAAVMITRSRYDSAILIADEAIKLFRELRDTTAEAYSLNVKGLAYNNKGDFSESAPLFSAALEKFKTIRDLDGQSRALNNLGITYYFKEDFENALKYYLESLEIREKLGGDKSTIATAMTNIGMVYRKMKNPDRALNYYSKALDYARESGNKSAELLTLNSMGAVYFDKQDYKTSRDYHLNALQLSIEIGDKQREALAYNNLGEVEQILGNNSNAISYYEKNIAILKSISSKPTMLNAYRNLSDLYCMSGQAQKALVIAKEMETIAEQSGAKEDKMATYYAFAEAYALNGNYQKAYQSFKYHDVLKDSLYDEKHTRTLEELAEKYESDKKNKQIELNEKQIALLENQKRAKNAQLVAIVSSFLLILSIAIFWYLQHRSKLAKEREMAEKNKIILELDLKNEKLNRELLEKEVTHKNNELLNLANIIVEKEDLIRNVADQAKDLVDHSVAISATEKIQRLTENIEAGLKIGHEREEFMNHIRQVQDAFYLRLEEIAPDLTVNEKRLCALLRMNFTSKQIAALLNISPSSVDMNRYRLRKKLKISSDQQLADYLNTLV